MNVRTALFLILVSAAGCAADTGAPAEKSLELGTGTWRFEPLADGQEVDLIRGAQGGWHVWVALRATGTTGDTAPLLLTVQPADESRPPAVTEAIARFDPPNDEGARAMLGWPAILSEPSCLVGELLRIEARVDMGGEELVAERDIVPLGGTYPPPPCE